MALEDLPDFLTVEEAARILRIVDTAEAALDGVRMLIASNPPDLFE